ncbi:hypothetical protein HII13_000546 [Brettanomyces bruxellensis]|uniref:Uncharacterized protein n=1 Tax=Dekkera bruxellensis TaxID=5007 RepID=A0A8H6BMA6_DEKBR|nr:uncharacterized protein BRETT_004289 [Brettanomyces bruxellensis]KAF6009760.1 hypothetical protein HII12_003306 [Brettanomyces bruxellensis]KAF6014201.1 hypothetical protein HII13_000546 [Brettanomyces bruxellensis]QOU19068.1 hypothetical protein BRETT_004289 [Brettanomyces bruxellensis]
MKPQNSTIAPKLVRLDRKELVKHAPPRTYHENETQKVVFVKSSTPFISAVKRIEKCLDGHRLKPNRRGRLASKYGNREAYVIVKGMGKAIPKVLNIGLHFKYEKNATLDVYTKTIGVLDEFKSIPEASNEDDLLRKRNVSSIEIRIYASEDELRS